MDETAMNELKAICPRAQELTEAGIRYIHLPALRLPSALGVLDALLCPQLHTGYATRLFFAQPLPGVGRTDNWTTHQILGNRWHTWSWKDVPATLRLAQILANHLAALR